MDQLGNGLGGSMDAVIFLYKISVVRLLGCLGGESEDYSHLGWDTVLF